MEGAGGALLLSFVPWSPAYGAQVVDVRAWPAEEYTRITIEHDAPMKFKYFVLLELIGQKQTVNIRSDWLWILTVCF